MKKLILVLFLCTIFFRSQSFASHIAEVPDYSESKTKDQVMLGHKLLQDWQVTKAGTLVLSLIKNGNESPRAYYLYGHYYFMIGEYEKSLDYLNGAGDYVPPRGVERYKSYLQAAFNNTKDFKSKSSEHFTVRFKPDKERLIVDALLEVMEKAYSVLGSDLGLKPSKKIIIEIYPKLDMLAHATGLTMKNLLTSGTIAISKFNRLMIASPRVSPYGYTWADTVSHEYVHLIICRISKNRVPIWLHEGLAKFYEARWRSDPGGHVSASGESLLVRALRENKLITLAEMHPSMALLPSQQHAQLAYTEVLMMVQWLYKLKGAAGLNKLLKTISKAKDLDQAFLQVYGFDVDGLYRRWLRTVKSMRLKELQYAFDDYSVLFGKENEPDPEREIKKLEQKQGRNFMTLGKLLKDRNHPKAASIEFQKASNTLGNSNPMLQKYLADSYIASGNYESASAALLPIISISPSYLPVRIKMAEALIGMENYQEATKHLLWAFWINPYDPRIYQMQKICYDKLANKELFKKAEQDLRLLMN